MNVQTDHQILGFGHNKMLLLDSGTGNVIVEANRTADGQPWTVHTDGVDDATAASRSEAVTAMTEHALAVLPGTGYSTLLANGLLDLP
ncbi:minor tail protein [Mycobacterium phage Aminay]|uniref:Uncharacterized protein n=1 Tax=Mycobacterium phage Aminay TaxID=2250291 RepID=A0A345KV14_9CAUD|nr:minor tail protein [Mycobacterium phage Aminay]AXH46866.1 hypothetical protein SEA_AMINAY_28 [Mycobacterium phage Aminay]